MFKKLSIYLFRYIFFFQMPWIPEALFQSEDLRILERMIRNVKGVNEDDIEMFKYTFQSHGNRNYSHDL